MNLYNQLKALKEAGFPQEPRISIGGLDGEIRCGFYLVTRPGSDECAVDFYREKAIELTINAGYELFKDPTVDELIDITGCRELYAPKETCEGNEMGETCGWVARWWEGMGENMVEAIGASPREALIKLYIALN